MLTAHLKDEFRHYHGLNCEFRKNRQDGKCDCGLDKQLDELISSLRQELPRTDANSKDSCSR